MPDDLRLLALAVIAQAMADATADPVGHGRPSWAVRRLSAQRWLQGGDPWLTFWLEVAELPPERIARRLDTVLAKQGRAQKSMERHFKGSEGATA